MATLSGTHRTGEGEPRHHDITMRVAADPAAGHLSGDIRPANRVIPGCGRSMALAGIRRSMTPRIVGTPTSRGQVFRRRRAGLTLCSVLADPTQDSAMNSKMLRRPTPHGAATRSISQAIATTQSAGALGCVRAATRVDKQSTPASSGPVRSSACAAGSLAYVSLTRSLALAASVLSSTSS